MIHKVRCFIFAIRRLEERGVALHAQRTYITDTLFMSVVFGSLDRMPSACLGNFGNLLCTTFGPARSAQLPKIVQASEHLTYNITYIVIFAHSCFPNALSVRLPNQRTLQLFSSAVRKSRRRTSHTLRTWETKLGAHCDIESTDIRHPQSNVNAKSQNKGVQII